MNAKTAAKRLIFVFLLAFALLFFLLAADILLGVSKDKNTWRPPSAPGVALDASGLDPVTVAETVRLSPDSVQALEQLHEAWQRARTQGLKIAIAGARHSMGDQSAYPNGIIIDMLDHNSMRLDSLSGADGKQIVLHVQTGARWSKVIQFLDARGYSVRIMQANNPFTVGGTLSVNAHGWQHGQPPFGSTVEAFDLFTSDGTVKHCDRRENAELFHLVIGGYGLFGVVLDADLRITQNVVYRAEHFRFPAREYARQYAEHVDGDTSLGLVYGRLSIAPSSFLREAILTRYVRQNGIAPELKPDGGRMTPSMWIKRELFLAGVGNAFGKEICWQLEKWMGGESEDNATRNSILNDPVTLAENHDATRTQLLHEYFIPRDSLESFLVQARRIIPEHRGDLLNVTVRNLRADTDAYLNYAREDVFSLVMTFSQSATPQGDSGMREMTRALIDAALAVRGTYYLPYRRHATREQFFRAYPMAASFFALKRKYDPQELFQNELYAGYALPGDPK